MYQQYSSILVFAEMAQTWLCSISSKAVICTLKRQHLSTDTEIVAEFAAGAVSAMCEDDQTSGSCGALGGTSQ